jgi:hypothetical protein
MTTRSLLAASAMSAMCMAPAFAQDATKPMTKPAPHQTMPGTPAAKPTAQPETGMPGMSPDDMKKMMQAMNPGPAHEVLNGMVGEWTADCKFWMPPTMAEADSKGTASNTWTLEKRFVKQEFNGSFAMPGMPEMPFHGLGYTGYDNTKNKYVSTWMDSMSTGIMYSEGTYDTGTKTFTFNATCTDPIKGTPTNMTEVIKIMDNDTHVFTMTGPGPDGKDVKMGEITYHRKGGMRPMDTMDKKMDKPKMDKPMPPPPANSPTAPKKMPG